MRLAISSIVFVAAFALVGCEKKVENCNCADASVSEKHACCEPAAPVAVDADAAVPVAPLAAPVAVAPAAVPAAVPVAAPTTTVTK